MKCFHVVTKTYGTINLMALDLKDARRDAKQRFGDEVIEVTKPPRRYRHCKRCDSRPCCCTD